MIYCVFRPSLYTLVIMPHIFVNMSSIIEWMTITDSAQKITPRHLVSAKNTDASKSCHIFWWGGGSQLAAKSEENFFTIRLGSLQVKAYIELIPNLKSFPCVLQRILNKR